MVYMHGAPGEIWLEKLTDPNLLMRKLGSIIPSIDIPYLKIAFITT
jgi:hypothetical protein